MLISILPFLFVNIYVVNMFINQSYNEINERNITEMEQVGSIFENNLGRIRESFIVSITDVLLCRRSYLYRGNSIWVRILLMNKISEIVKQNEYIDSIYFYNKTLDYLLITDYGITNTKDERYAWIKHEINNNIDSNKIFITDIRVLNENYVVSLIGKTRSTSHYNDYIIFNINLGKMFNDSISNLKVDEPINNYFIMTSTNKIIMDNDVKKINTTLDNAISNEVLAGKNSYLFDNNMINVYSLKNVDWHLVKETNLDKIYASIKTIRNTTYILVFVITAIILMMVLTSSVYIYKPIHSVIENVKNSFNTGQLNDWDEFEFIDNALESVNQQTITLREDLKRHELILKKTLIYNLIKNKVQIEMRKDEIYKYFHNESTSFVVVIYKAITDVTNSKEIDFHYLIEAAANKHFKVDVFCEKKDEYIALYRTNDSDINVFMDQFRESLKTYEEILDNFIISIGKIYNKIEGINDSYIEAVYIYNYANINSKGKIFSYDKIAISHNDSRRKSNKMLEMEVAIRNQDEGTYIDLLECMFNNTVSLTEYNDNFFIMISLVLKVFKCDSTTILNELNDLIANNSIMNVEKLRKFFYTKFMDLKDNDESTVNSEEYLKKINQFIKANYNRDISLEDASNHVGITKQYICNLYKKIFNTSFIEYLNSYRVEKAKQLLKNQDNKIKDIYSEIGFNSSSYFIKVFKLYTGLTPSQYQKVSNSADASNF